MAKEDDDRHNKIDVHSEVLSLLLEKINDDPYPSTTMMDMVEEMLRPDEVPAYVAILIEKISADTFPSISLMDRIRAFA